MTTILCSAYDEVHKVVCDLPLKHQGPHKATVIFGDEETGDDDS